MGSTRPKNHHGPLSHALSQSAELWQSLKQKRPALFLDYDGTLSPIAARPELARLSPSMKTLLKELSAQIPVAIISGRGREDVAALVDLPQLIYAGSHGMDIKGPAIEKIAPGAHALLPIIQEAKVKLQAQLHEVSGVLVEDKKFSLAIHYRQAPHQALGLIEKLVDQVGSEFPQLKKTLGKKIFELRANIPWDKGKALTYLLESLALNPEQYFPIYIGDDETDEDAFAALQEEGAGILVHEAPRKTFAQFYLKDVGEVESFLGEIHGLLATQL